MSLLPCGNRTTCAEDHLFQLQVPLDVGSCIPLEVLEGGLRFDMCLFGELW
jgi:hypothetical protein